MNNPNKPESEEPFETAWKAWLAQPLRPQPGTDWLQDRIAQRSRRQRIWYPLVATAALASVLGIGLFVRHKEALAPGSLAKVTLASPMLGQGEVLIWLDDQTPLYMTFQSPE